MTSEGAVLRKFILVAQPHTKAACCLYIKWLRYWSFPRQKPLYFVVIREHVQASQILPWKENECHSCEADVGLRNSSPLLPFFLSRSLPPIQCPARCHLLGCSDIFWKILTPKPYRPCMLLKNTMATGSCWAPPETQDLQQNLWSLRSRLVRPGLRQPAPSSSGHSRSRVQDINSAAALPAAEPLLPDRGCAGVKGAL